MKVTELNEGKKIAYAVKKTVLTLDGGRIALDLQKYQKDYPVTLDFMTDGEGNLLMNAFDSLRAYVAEIRLPAYETETVEVEDEETAAADTTPADEQDAAAQAGVTEEAQDAETVAQGETQKKTVTRRLPLDMSKVELDLFAISGIYINQLDGEF
jgi:nucleoid-associated protein YgaU